VTQCAPDAEARIAAGLCACADGLALAARESLLPHQAFVSTGLVLALQGALVAALSGYATAEWAHVRDPSDAARTAPIALLLRRAQSGEYLNSPERLHLSRARSLAVARLVAHRNARLHAENGVPVIDAGDAAHALAIVSHLVVTAPAFPITAHILSITRVTDAMRSLFLPFAPLD
jgi:hypothetical protein